MAWMVVWSAPAEASVLNTDELNIPVVDIKQEGAYPLLNYSKLLKVPYNVGAEEALNQLHLFESFHPSDLELDPEGNFNHYFLFHVNSSIAPIYLALPLVQNHYINLYKIDSGGLKEIGTGGVMLPNNVKYVPYSNELFELKGELNQDEWYLLKINRLIFKTYSTQLYTPKAFITHNYQTSLVEGILLGVIVCVVLYHFFIYLRMREKEYILLALYMTFLFFQVTGYSGHFVAMANFENPKWNTIFYNLLPSFSAFFSLWFSYVFLNLNRKGYPISTAIFIVFQGLFVVSAVSALLQIPFLERLTVSISGFAVIFLFSLGIYRMRERFKPANVYLIAYIPTFISVPYLLYYTAGNLEYSWFTHNNLMISIVAQAILFSLAIAAKIRILKDEKETLLREENERLEVIVEQRTSELRAEKMNVEKLLLNILPLEVANELKATGSSEARHFGNVTVLFTDFVDFTGISQKLSPQDLVKEVDYLFKEFDDIIERNKLEKIKTIGDAYMAVCGLPDEYPNHAHRAVQAALEIRDFIQDYFDQGGLFRIRIGLHSGPVVAGIVGVKKFQYDIWGDTVNTAARMEQNSVPGKVNISGETNALIQPDFKVEYRGKIAAKNKGEVDMYFVL